MKLTPYILNLTTEKGKLLYYGSIHTIDINHLQFRDIEKRWQAFQPDIALSEGGIWPLEPTKVKAILEHGEQGLLRYLAARDNVPIKSIEPRRKFEAMYLLKQFSQEQIKVFYILRQVVIRRMLNKDINDITYVEHILKELSKLKLFRGGPNCFLGFLNSVKKFFPNLGDWRTIPGSWFYESPTGEHTWLSLMFRKVNNYRNHRMVRTILKEINRGRSIFALVGRSHVIMQQQAICDCINKIYPEIFIDN
jgi:hypothetical protein